ncbi:glycosyltransferase [Ramlibacter monticola]|uniref:Glycosyltransferase n=1 Tax=Ramlibacter monticola TaxID=1926872 RepID=A0A937CX81_9BURK|nr:glycosyltransferase [Ramlibacter monticola]MBL0395028.1 glycosyltransferase [Ramlibacter monticola]
MLISIAMATYNGAKYLPDQLESFANQRVLPQELVVCDDRSTDNTMSVLQSFRRHAPFDVRIIPNERRLGYSANFEKALNSCSGEIIFISDQDDVWLPKKTASVLGALAQCKAMVVLNDQEITDANLTRTGRTIMGNTRTLGFKETWISAGCCTAVRREFLELLNPFPNHLLAYDAWIHKVAVELGTRQVVPEVHQLYRRHSSNTSAPLATTFSIPNRVSAFMHFGLRDVSDGWDVEVQISRELTQRLRERAGTLNRFDLHHAGRAAIRKEEEFVEALTHRRSFLKQGRIHRFGPLLRFFLRGGYVQFSGVRSAAKDLLRPSVRTDRPSEP